MDVDVDYLVTCDDEIRDAVGTIAKRAIMHELSSLMEIDYLDADDAAKTFDALKEAARSESDVPRAILGLLAVACQRGLIGASVAYEKPNGDDLGPFEMDFGGVGAKDYLYGIHHGSELRVSIKLALKK